MEKEYSWPNLTNSFSIYVRSQDHFFPQNSLSLSCHSLHWQLPGLFCLQVGCYLSFGMSEQNRPCAFSKHIQIHLSIDKQRSFQRAFYQSFLIAGLCASSGKTLQIENGSMKNDKHALRELRPPPQTAPSRGHITLAWVTCSVRMGGLRGHLG